MNKDFVILSQPKFNQQLSSIEFEVRLHSYPMIHHPPTTTTNSLLLLLTAPASQAGSTTIQSQLWPGTGRQAVLQSSNFNVFQIEGFGSNALEKEKNAERRIHISPKCYCDRCS
jgi:hypothetical protein